jgi:hypothetical protein
LPVEVEASRTDIRGSAGRAGSSQCADARYRAHAIVVAAQPAMNFTVVSGELEIKLDFNRRVDQKRSRLSLQRPDGTEVAVALTPGGPSGVLTGRAQVAEEGVGPDGSGPPV